MALADSTNPLKGVSGPGKFAKRTDLQFKPDSYGDGVAMDALKSGAPLASTPDVRGATNTQVRQAAQSAGQAPTSLYAPTERPQEPVTHGIDVGAGAGSEALTMKSQFAQAKLSDTLAQMLPFDTSGEIGILYQRAVARGM